MNKFGKSVLIIGFGKIGRVKSAIWKGFQIDVYIYDVSKDVMNEAEKLGYNTFEMGKNRFFNFIDICVPTKNHISIVEKIVNKIKFDNIIVEKPLCSDLKDILKIEDLLNKDKSLKEKILVNEQYYESKTLKFLKEHVKNFSEISIDISKNRLNDIKKGRFIDSDIFAYGIEIPHVLAILEVLGIDISESNIKILKNILYLDDKCFYNQGILCEIITKKGCKVKFTSFLGDFKIDSDEIISSNRKINRTIKIKSSENTFIVVLDPHPCRKRLNTEITLNEKKIIFYDDMLAELIKDVINNNVPKECTIDKAINNSITLIGLYQNKSIKKIKFNKAKSTDICYKK